MYSSFFKDYNKMSIQETGNAGEGKNEIMIWLEGLELRDVNKARSAFDNFGIDSVDTLNDLEFNDIEELILMIKVFPDRIKIRKALKKMKNDNNNAITDDGNGDKIVIITQKEQMCLNRLKEEIKNIQSIISDINESEIS